MTQSSLPKDHSTATGRECHVLLVLGAQDLSGPDGSATPEQLTHFAKIVEAASRTNLSHLSVIIEEGDRSDLMRCFESHRQYIDNKQINVVVRVDKPDEVLSAEGEDGKNMQLGLLGPYDGKADIVAVLRTLSQKQDQKNRPEAMTSTAIETAIDRGLRFACLPDPDLVVYFDGRKTLGNLGVWIGAYSEFAFLAQAWHSFRIDGLNELLADFGLRERRFGSVGS